MKNKLSPFLVFLASLFWATDSPFRKPLLTGGLGIGFVAFLEHIFNTIASLPGLWKHRKSLLNLSFAQILGLVYIGAVASALAAILFVKGAALMNYNFTVAALLQKVQPLVAIVLAAIFLKERIPSKFWFLAIPAVFGAYLVSFGWASPQSLWVAQGNPNLAGVALAVLAAALWAGGTVVGRGLLSDLNFQVVTGLRFLLGLIFLFGYVFLFEKFQFDQMQFLFWRNIFIIAMLTGFLSLLLYYFGLRNTKASLATLMELGYPLALTVVNWKFLGIALSRAQILGTLVLLISVTALVLLTNKSENDPERIYLKD